MHYYYQLNVIKNVSAIVISQMDRYSMKRSISLALLTMVLSKDISRRFRNKMWHQLGNNCTYLKDSPSSLASSSRVFPPWAKQMTEPGNKCEDIQIYDPSLLNLVLLGQSSVVSVPEDSPWYTSVSSVLVSIAPGPPLPPISLKGHFWRNIALRIAKVPLNHRAFILYF